MQDKDKKIEILKREDDDYSNQSKKAFDITSKTHYLIFQNIYVDIVCYILISIVIFGSAYLTLNIEEQTREVRLKNPDFKLPDWKDLTPSLLLLLPSFMFNYIVKKTVYGWAKRNLDPVYLKDNDPEIIKTYAKKVCSNLFKFFFYLFNTILGYYVLKDLPFMPKMLLGNGSFDLLFKPGYPDLFYWKQPPLFDFYYNLNLTFGMFDLVILLTHPLQSDFLVMVLHHFASISLQVFSYLYGYSNIGCIVCFLHYYGDIYSYVVRTSIYLKGSYEHLKFGSTLCFLINFIYTRIIVFSTIIYAIITELHQEWKFIEYSMTTFLIFLILLHVLWTVLITKKFIKYCITGNIEEIYKVKISKKES